MYIFKGENGSLGYETGKSYSLNVETMHSGVIIINSEEGNECIYSSKAKFLENWIEIDSGERYVQYVKLLDRFYSLYKKGRDAGAPSGYIDFFQAEHFLLLEVEKAFNQNIKK